MSIEGRCEICGGTTSDYNCLSCVMAENDKLTREVQDLRDLCRGAFIVIRDQVTTNRIGKIVVCTLQGNLWRAANAIPLCPSPCGAKLKDSDQYCKLPDYHEGQCK
jgi:hypothetical protein